MSLPDLALQIVYGRLAWALVAAAMLLAILPVLKPALLSSWLSKLSPKPSPAVFALRPRRSMVNAAFAPGVVIAAVVLMALPDAASPAYWLTLVFQYPSALLVGFSLVSLHARWQGRPARLVMPPALAVPLVVAGLVLYLDAFGVLALGLYSSGFGAVGAPLIACAAAIACAVAIARGQAVAGAAALLVAVLLFSVLRLPSGNLWDALLDPLLWSWALGSTVVALVRRRAARRAELVSPLVEPVAAPIPEPVLAHAAGNEQI
jgi:hypothetical protein